VDVWTWHRFLRPLQTRAPHLAFATLLSAPPAQGHKKAVPAEPKPGDRSTLTPAQKKEADAKAMKEKMERKAAEAAAGGADGGGGGGGGGKKGGK
jgi:hypothetical protein